MSRLKQLDAIFIYFAPYLYSAFQFRIQKRNGGGEEFVCEIRHVYEVRRFVSHRSGTLQMVKKGERETIKIIILIVYDILIISQTHLQTPYDAFYVGKRPQSHMTHHQTGLVVYVTVPWERIEKKNNDQTRRYNKLSIETDSLRTM